MSKEELGDFLCDIAGRCELCELRELCSKKYPKGYSDWLEDTYNGDITKGFHTPENSISGEIHDYFGEYIPLGKNKKVNWIEKALDRMERKIIELEKENNIMSNTTDFEKVLGKKNVNVGEAIMDKREDLCKSLNEQLSDMYKKFSQWISEIQIAMNSIKELDEALVEMQKTNNTDK